jgi:hypothetical protein
MGVNFKFCFLLICCFIDACSNSPNIQIVRQSSNLLHCEKIFAQDLEAIEERNEILLQTGSIDTTDEQAPIKTAILRIDNADVILSLFRSYSQDNKTIEIYAGANYSLTLTYTQEKDNQGKLTYHGNFLLENNGFRKQFEIAGRNCNL